MTTVLFTERESNYLALDCDCYDQKRNALTFTGSNAFIAHPPCRSWGRLRQFSRSSAGEHLLAVWAVLKIWRNGGVLEHPAGSSLWKKLNLPLPGSKFDLHGGFTLSIDQHWFGHKCKKNTWLYVVGLNTNQLPAYPLNFDVITHVVGSSNNITGAKELPKNERSSTPVDLCNYLIEIIKIIESNKKQENERK